MNCHPYEDIIHLPHHTSTTKQRMPLENRAAQFAPFSALAGFENVLDESRRSVEKQYDREEQNRRDFRKNENEDKDGPF